MRLLERYNFSSFVSDLSPSIATIKLFFKLSYVRFERLSRFSILDIWLCDKFMIRNELSTPKPSIFDILLLCKSNTSSLVN